MKKCGSIINSFVLASHSLLPRTIDIVVFTENETADIQHLFLHVTKFIELLFTWYINIVYQ